MSITMNLRTSTEEIMHRTKLLLAFAALTGCAPQPPAMAPAPAAQDTARIANLFRNLRPPLEIVGRPAVRWTLDERMAHHKVPGVSVALIENGRIAWAGGVGVLEASRPRPSASPSRPRPCCGWWSAAHWTWMPT
jgi:CubicO group peptidase (beta-lactamase class C family)